MNKNEADYEVVSENTGDSYDEVEFRIDVQDHGQPLNDF